MGLSFKIAAGPLQCSHSQVRVPRDSWPYFTVSDSRLLQPGGLAPRIYIPLEQGDPVKPPGTELYFRRLLRLAGLRWKYSAPPPHGISDLSRFCTTYIVSRRTDRKRIRCPAVDICEPQTKYLLCCQECVFIGPLPNNGSTCHNIFKKVFFFNIYNEVC
jgi:hypothetical protein